MNRAGETRAATGRRRLKPYPAYEDSDDVRGESK